jgi:hypothetical protein
MTIFQRFFRHTIKKRREITRQAIGESEGPAQSLHPPLVHLPSEPHIGQIRGAVHLPAVGRQIHLPIKVPFSEESRVIACFDKMLCPVRLVGAEHALILLHGVDSPPGEGDPDRSEAQEEREAFAALSDPEKDDLLTFLRSLILFELPQEGE